MAYALLPSRYLDDTIYLPDSYPPCGEVYVPPENLLIGLCAEGNRVLVLAWPGTIPAVSLDRDPGSGAQAGFGGARVMLAGQPLYLALFDTAGIWYRADLANAPLEQDLPQPWKAPHRARWITQLTEEGDFPTTYEVKDKAIPKDSFWRAGFGRYAYPVWFGKDGLTFQFCQKVTRKDMALVYALDGHAQTPFEFLRTRLTPEARASLSELTAVKPVRDGDFVPPGPAPGWARACFGRDRMEASILRVDVQAREQAFLEEHFRFRAREARGPETQNRLYAEFIVQMTELLAREKAGTTDGKRMAYLESMGRSLASLEETYRDAMQGKTSAENLAYVDAVTEALCQRVRDPGPERLSELRYNLSELNDVLNRNHRVGGSCGRVLRKWFLTAALECADTPAAVGLALEVRQDIRQVLQHRNDESVARVSQDLR